MKSVGVPLLSSHLFVNVNVCVSARTAVAAKAERTMKVEVRVYIFETQREAPRRRWSFPIYDIRGWRRGRRCTAALPIEPTNTNLMWGITQVPVVASNHSIIPVNVGTMKDIGLPAWRRCHVESKTSYAGPQRFTIILGIVCDSLE